MAADEEPQTVDGEAVPFTGTWETESYVHDPVALDPGDKPDILQVIFDAGLIGEINVTVLHRHGLAIGVTSEDGKVKGVNFHRTDDPAGLWFDEDNIQALREKQVSLGLTLTPEQRGCKS